MIYPSTFEHKIGFDKVRERVAALTASAGARKLAESFGFMTDFRAVEEELERTHEMLRLIVSDAPPPSLSAGEAPGALTLIRVPGTSCSPAEMLSISKALDTMASAEAYFKAAPVASPRLAEIVAGLPLFPRCSAAIARVLDKFGVVKDNASPALAEIRRALAATTGTVNSVLRRVMARAVSDGILDSDTTPAVRDGRLVLPVPPMNKRRIPGIVHDESASGKTVFIEPAEVVEVNNRIRQLQLDERREIVRILAALAEIIRPDIPEILRGVSILDTLDFIHAKASYAGQIDANMPHLSPEPQLEWFHALHPVLLKSLRAQGKEIVPLDIRLTPEQRILVISGPNAGGKSVCLKTVGILQYMTQCGLLPPVYENSHFGIFSDIFIDIGDNQSIEDDLSTYSSHLRDMKTMLARAKSSSLVLIDEFGSGTEPQIGGAIAQAILHRFNDTGLWGVITTHYQNLKHFAETTPGLVNGSMLYDRNLMKPLFRLSIGNAGSSFAIEIARNTGLPAQIIDEAAEIVGSDYIRIDKFLLDTARDKKYWENKRQEIKRKENQLNALLEKYAAEAEALRAQRRQIIEDAKNQAVKIIDESNASVERTIREIRTAQAERERTLAARAALRESRKELEAKDLSAHPALARMPRPKKKAQEKPRMQTPERQIAAGDNVLLDDSPTPGKVISIEGSSAIVAFGTLKTKAPLNRLRLTDKKIKTVSDNSPGPSTSESSRQRQLDFSRDVDLRGMRVDEALQAVTYFIDDAVQFGADTVRILHGTGTGALRAAIRQYLETVPAVKSFHDEHVQFGGAGITVVHLD